MQDDTLGGGTLVGQTLGRYRLLAKLGEGGMAAVYRAYDPHLRRDVVVKVILQRPDRKGDLLRRFRLEAKTLAQLSHPGIVKVLDYGEQGETPYLVMEYIRGGTLKDRLGRPLPWHEAARLLAPVARALADAHARGIVHRDVKPANILLNEAGVPLLSDFGIAKILSPTGPSAAASAASGALTSTGVSMGTPAYISPEQGLGRDVDHRTDIYALGIVFFELVTGLPPFDADTPMGLIIKHIQDPPPRPRSLLPALPADVERVIMKALAKKPEDRFASMAAFATVLDKLAQGRRLSRAEAPNVPGLPEVRPVWAVLGGGVAGLAGLAGLAACALLAVFVLARLGRTPAAPPEIPNGFVYVAAVSGDARLADASGERALRRGSFFEAGSGILVQTGRGEVELGLTDGTAVFVGPATGLEFSEVADPSRGVTATVLTLQSGAALATVSVEPGSLFALRAPTGARVEVALATVGVIFAPAEQRLDVDCLAGACRLAFEGRSLELPPGAHSAFTGAAGPSEPDAARPDLWAFTGLPLATESPVPLSTATATGTPTPSATASPTLTPTATATPSATFTRTRPPPTATSTDTPTPVPPPPTATNAPPPDEPEPPTSRPPTPPVTEAPPTPAPPPPTEAPPTSPPPQPT
jgi:tRNA A-37 threonylcarbamoyl transferase component Bud32